MNNQKAGIITIGDEILYGHILDTNAQWISAELTGLGLRVAFKHTVGDNRADIMEAFERGESHADLVIVTGGLGPTSDDLTKPLLAEYFGCDLVMNQEALKNVTAFFESRGRELTATNKAQAMLPACCEMLLNPLGTAPGMWFDTGDKIFVSLPGVPFEMKHIMENEVFPRLKNKFHLPVIYHKIIKTAGIGESWLADKIRDWESTLPGHIKLAYLPGMAEVKLRLTAVGADRAKLEKEVVDQIGDLRGLVGKYIYGYDDMDLAGAVGLLLKDKNLTISTAESCTGGFLAHRITSIPGSSNYYKGSILAYDNAVKIAQLGVSREVLDRQGAVSEETVIQMAEGVRHRMGTDIGVSTSGIAGPDGGTDEKPVGTIWIAFCDGKNTVAKKLMLGRKDRLINIKSTAQAALNLIRLQLSEYF
ncbi:MAG: competence/damage-inducible protein A [Cyclobacteriaceae bacterium]|nr:competence/damage-inducible protein A [Cyclobacteriaceae bacterium]